MLYSLQFMRFVAAAIVVVTHSFNVLGIPKASSIGDIGVDIFFVISGIVISIQIDKGASPINFGLKRLIRIYPLYWLALFTLIFFEFVEWRWVHTWGQIGASALLIPTNEYILFPAWTLSYEMLFYTAVFAALCINARRAKVIATALIIAVAFSPIHLGFAQPLLCLEFLFGFWMPRRSLNTNGPRALGIFLISAAAVAIYFAPHPTVGNRAFIWGLPCTILLYGILQFEGVAFFKHPRILPLGEASYAMYLFHIPIMTALVVCLGDHGFHMEHHLPAIALIAPLAIVASLRIHVTLEERFQNWLKGAVLRPRT